MIKIKGFFRNFRNVGIVLLSIILICSITGLASYYKYTQESGTNFYVSEVDKSDALEDTNELRQIWTHQKGWIIPSRWYKWR